MNREITRGTLEMSLAMLISGTIGWFVLVSEQPVFNVVFWRCLFGALALLLICAALGLLKSRVISRKAIAIAMLGGVAIVLNWICLFAAYSLTSISIATIVYNTQPFMLVMLGAMVLGERITMTKLAWLGVSFFGMLFVVLAPSGMATDHAGFLFGIALSLGAAFLYAIASMVTKHLKGTPPHLIALIQVTTGMIMLAPLADFSALPETNGQWLSLVTLGIAHTGFMYCLLYSAIQKLPTYIIGSLSFIYPVVAVVVDMLAFGHVLQPIQFLGGALILFAAAGATLGWQLPKLRQKPETS